MSNPARITVNGVDFSDHVSSVAISFSEDRVETTNLQIAGLRSDVFSVTFQWDEA